MKRALFAVALCLASPVMAQTVRVQAGEHPGFTRLVLNLPAPDGWQVARTATGYEVNLQGAAPRFDLSGVFRAIPRTRLATIWVDPESGRLQLGVDCACHAIPFAFRPDIIVIDLKDGPAPPGSMNEATLTGGKVPPLSARTVSILHPRPAPQRIAGVVTPRQPKASPPAPRPDLARPFRPDIGPLAPKPLAGPPLNLPDMRVEGLRQGLLEQLGRAASAGLIEVDDPVFPDPPRQTVRHGLELGPLAHLATELMPGVSALPANTPRPGLTQQGASCLPDKLLDLAAWGDDRAYADQLAAMRARLLGEFDRPDPERLADLVRLMLHFGFGAEARNLLVAFPTEPAQAALWRAMAEIMDQGSPAADSPFGDQAACPGASALWASLALPSIPPGDATNVMAVSAAFSALPVHLRRHLGPGLAEKFLAAGDVATAQRLRAAIWRAPGDPGPGAQLVDGQIARAHGDLARAEASLAIASRDGGPMALRALIELVDTRLALGETLDAALVTELAAQRHQHRDGPMSEPLLRAEILARASAGDFDMAFELARDAQAQAQSDLWGLLGRVGPDSALVTHGILGEDSPMPEVDGLTRERIGNRLLALGFAEAALRWLPPANLIGVAQAELMRGDPRSALRTIAGLADPEADKIRARALARLGAPSGTTSIRARTDTAPDPQASSWHAQGWRTGTPDEQQARNAAFDALAPLPPRAPDAPLAEARALVDNSASARAAIGALLQGLPDPANLAGPRP